MNQKIEEKEKDNILLVSQIIFKYLSPDFEKPYQTKYCKEFGLKYNLESSILVDYVSCIKKHRGINNRTFNISQRNKEVIEFIAELTISELEKLVYLNNLDRDFNLHTYLKEENNENKD